MYTLLLYVGYYTVRTEILESPDKHRQWIVNLAEEIWSDTLSIKYSLIT